MQAQDTNSTPPQKADHIHNINDGRGRRRVLVNGAEVKGAFYADTREGVVLHYDSPPVVAACGTECIQHTLQGKVEVEFIPDVA